MRCSESFGGEFLEEAECGLLQTPLASGQVGVGFEEELAVADQDVRFDDVGVQQVETASETLFFEEGVVAAFQACDERGWVARGYLPALLRFPAGPAGRLHLPCSCFWFGQVTGAATVRIACGGRAAA